MAREPQEGRPIANEPSTLSEAADRGEAPAALSWSEALSHLARAEWFWLATADSGGHPRLRPLLAVLTDGYLHFSSSPNAQKAKNLGRQPRCALAAHTEDSDLIVEGTSRRIIDPDELERVAASYRDRYQWPVTVVGDAMDAPYGAPTAGPPPYAVFRVLPSRAYALGITDSTNFRSTRWRF
jgi:Pyridoxamine 5'-phosphate oxidase